ncbi:LTA synthase family protein [Bifidobacterium samirii]
MSADNITTATSPATTADVAEHGDTSAGTSAGMTTDATTESLTVDGTAARAADRPLLPRIKSALAAAKHTVDRVIRSKPVQLVASFFGMLWRLWKKRMRFSYASYAIVFVMADAFAVLALQWSVYSEPTYDDPDAVDATTRIMNSMAGQLTKFVSQMWLEHHMTFLLNFLALAMIYLVVVFLTNRFWVATAVFFAVMSAFAVANRIKVELRSEPIIPADLNFLSSGNGGEIASFIPENDLALVTNAIRMIIVVTVLCVILQILDGRRCVIPFHWWRPLRDRKTIGFNCMRIAALATSVAVLVSFTWNLSIAGTWSYDLAKKWNDAPVLWNAFEDSRNNGPAMNFLRLSHSKTMDKPEDYSKETMLELAERYAKSADRTNEDRANELTDSTVIMVLSETFSDPTRVPGIELLEDPMPNIRAIKEQTTSGLMLSSGLGGGTANIEYQALTGMNLALFHDSLQSPYQELVPLQKNPFSFNQLWNERYGDEASVAFHPYQKNMYLRDTDYKKFGFSKFYTLDSDPQIAHQDRVDNSGYVSDAAAYQSVLDELQQHGSEHRFVQLVTMQNHLPYNGWYADNQFWEYADISQLGDDERFQIDTYAKGISITDQATADFLAQLNQMDEPITVIFYGDHLPSSYTTASADQNNSLVLHETDYFIWSNQASTSSGVKLGTAANYTSSNFFMALASEHMGAKVSPYLEMLSEVSAAVPAMTRLISGNANWGNGSATYLDANGTPLEYDAMSEEAKQLMEDYRLVQYDLTAGKNYLQDTDFLVTH